MRSLSDDQATVPRNDLKTIRTLIPYLWLFKRRVLLALGCLILAKAAVVTMPWALKAVVDHLDTAQNAVLTLPLAILLGYGALRLTSSLFGELRDAIFAKVTQSSVRRIALKVFKHLHGLSLRFHLERQTGGVSRDIERGSRGISFLLSFLVFNIIPTLFEILLVKSEPAILVGVLAILAPMLAIYALDVLPQSPDSHLRPNDAQTPLQYHSMPP